MAKQTNRVFYLPGADDEAPTLPGADPLSASMSMPAPAFLRALSEMPGPPAAVKAPVAVEDWSLPAPAAASSQEEDTVRTVAMSAAQRKEQSSRRFLFFR